MEIWVVHAQEPIAEPRSVPNRRQWRSNMIAETLAERGHKVTRWRSSFSHYQKAFHDYDMGSVATDGYETRFIHTSAYRRHVGLKRVISHRRLGRNFADLARAQNSRPDLIHVGNVPIELLAAAVTFGRERHVPVVADIRDLWPDIYVDRLPRLLEPLAPSAQAWLNRPSSRVRKAFRDATGLTALTPSYLEWGLEKAGRALNEFDGIFPMSYPDLMISDLPEARRRLARRIGRSLDGKTVVTYAGSIGYQSEFRPLIDAARIVRTSAPQVEFVIAGEGPELPALRRYAAGVANVSLPGWLDVDDLRDLLMTASVGLIAFKSIPNYLLNIPNKFPEYLAAGLAIACGIAGEMGGLVGESGCGMMYEAADGRSLASVIESMASSHARLATMQASALELHRSAFTSSKIYPRFAAHLELIARKCQGAQ